MQSVSRIYVLTVPHVTQPAVVPVSDADDDLATMLFNGFYPPIFDRGIPPQDWYSNYYRTYVERDVRTILQVGDSEAFSRFIRLCAGRTGQLLNTSSIASDCGISHETARRWLSVLEASFVMYLLRPHHANFSKRLIKLPKLYFMDTGLLCCLLRIRDPQDLLLHAMRGLIFENFVVMELLKAYYNRGSDADIYFWRDSAGHKVDILLDNGGDFTVIEVKSGQTIASEFFKGIEFWRSLPGQAETPAALLHGGSEARIQRGVHVYAGTAWL